MTYSPPDIRKLANTFTEDQTIEAHNNLLLADVGALATIGGGIGSPVFYLRNAKWNGTTWVRTLAENNAQRVQLDNNGDFIFSTNSDAGNTVGSTITWAEKFRITKNGDIITTGDQTIEAGNVLKIGTAGTFGDPANDGAVSWTRNARWTGTNWVRLLADNDASMLYHDLDGALVYLTNTDANNTVGSTITWAERFRIAKSGILTTQRFVGVRAFRTAAEAITNATTTPISLNAESYDTDGFHDNTTNNERITIPSGLGGYYHLDATAGFAPNGTGARFMYIRRYNSAGALQRTVAAPVMRAIDVVNTESRLSASGDDFANAGDYFRLEVHQDSGGTLNTTTTDGFQVLGCHRIGS